MNFALILFILLVISAALWLADRFYFRKRRASDAREPVWVEYGASFFPVILIVFLLRSFLVEPFKIPSGSMLPTLLVGDFIAVNKFAYGIRLPVINKKIIEIGAPQRGDVVVFRYPPDPSLDYIKRVVGVPGDRVAWQNKRLAINGVPLELRRDGDYFDAERLFYTPRYEEKLGAEPHMLLIEEDAPAYVPHVMQYPLREKCNYNAAGVICEVPAGHYFVMGDNRDNSQDSRVWGFVPDENLVGRAFYIWFNFRDLKRIGGFR
ncbi:MAG: signal peptidase I [Sulfuritalea sp.]|nr:signal peptidase I [Sulfuritalea sp.]